MTYPTKPVNAAMNSFPIKLKNPPITVKTDHLPKFLIITAKPSNAEVQKFLPLKAI